MSIFDSLLAIFEASIIFKAAWALSKIGSSLKPNRNKQVQPS